MRAAGIKRLKTLHSILHLGDHLKGRRAADAAKGIEVANDMAARTMLFGEDTALFRVPVGQRRWRR